MKDDLKKLLEDLTKAVRSKRAYQLETCAGALNEHLLKDLLANPDRFVAAAADAAGDGDPDRVAKLCQMQIDNLRDAVYREDDIAEGDPEIFVGALEDAVHSFDRKRAGELCELLLTHLHHRPKPYPFDPSKQILDLLRRKRYFDLLQKVADVLIQTGQDAPRIRRQLAQSLLDENRLTAGLEVLRDLKRRSTGPQQREEFAEACGLIGRAHKQSFMNAGDNPSPALKQELVKAIEAYAEIYSEDKENIWHGINSVALQKRAADAKPRIRIPSSVPVGGVKKDASGILKTIEGREKKEKANAWDFATAGEAHVALGQYDKALKYITKYTSAGIGDAFEYGSTLRQFEEVWQLDGSKKEQAQILQLLRASLLRQEGGELSLSDAAQELRISEELADDPKFEAILGLDLYKSFGWYRQGLSRAEGVAKVLNSRLEGHGTGFLLKGSDVHSSITDQWVFMTNAHVLSNDPDEHSGSPRALPPPQAQIQFEGQDTQSNRVGIKDIIFSSGRHNLDCTIATLSAEPQLSTAIPIAPALSSSQAGQARPRAYVIGHPAGGGLSFSLHDNVLLDYDPPRIHYRARTEGGSSGSPVFNGNWELIALHHAGSENMRRLNNRPGTYEANEGNWILSILKAVRDKLG